MAYKTSSEQKIITSTSSNCDVEAINDVELTSPNEAIAAGFDDPTILHTVMCWNNSLMRYPPNPQKLNSTVKIRRELYDSTTIPNGEVNRLLPIVRGGGGSRPFMVKSPSSADSALTESIIHEYFIGSLGTNRLRERLPNFIYVLGLLSCSPSFATEPRGANVMQEDRGRVLAFCESSDPLVQTNHLLLENISDSDTLDVMIGRGCTVEEFISVLIQLIAALQAAYEEFEYTNYALVSSKVLIRRLSEETVIEYEGVGYLRTRFIATIIDQSRAFMKYKNTSYGDSTTSNISFPMADVFSLVLSSLYTARLLNTPLYEATKGMLTFFSEKSDLLDTAGASNWSLEHSDELDKPPMEFFARVIARSFRYAFVNTVSRSPPLDSSTLFGCRNRGDCLSVPEAIDTYFTPKRDLVNSPYLFYEQYYTSNYPIRDFEFFENHMEVLGEEFIALSNEYNDISGEVVQFNEEKNRFLNYVDRFVLASDLMKSMFDVAKITVGIQQLYPAWTDEQIDGQMITYRQIFETIYAPRLKNSIVLNQLLKQLHDDVDKIKDPETKAVVENAIVAIDYFPSEL